MAAGGVAIGAAALGAAPAGISHEFFGWSAGQIPQIAAGCLFYSLGLLLPDCDQPGSTLGKYVHIPVEHRTWTHTLWFMLPFIGLGFLFWPFWALAAGMAVHLFCDSLSKCGVCWLYPISKYKHFGGKGAKIKKGHFVSLYSSGKGETIVCSLFWLITLMLAVFAAACWNPGFAELTKLTGAVDGFSNLTGMFFKIMQVSP